MLLADFPLQSVSLLSKISKGKIDVIKHAQTLEKDRKISEYIYFFFGEMYLQKCEEYFGGEQIGSEENGEWYKGIACFMIKKIHPMWSSHPQK